MNRRLILLAALLAVLVLVTLAALNAGWSWAGDRAQHNAASWHETDSNFDGAD